MGATFGKKARQNVPLQINDTKRSGSYANKAHFDDEEILTIYLDQILMRSFHSGSRIEAKKNSHAIMFKNLNLLNKRCK